ncbi:MAG TPA: outer membrane beta-barrel domain-containing protein [Myxococcaceae bacterium]|nr:outer membrane beta-barrel domain-containing protein [Myxococcaceae bacterium]
MNARLVILVAIVLGQVAAAQDLSPSTEAGDTAAVDRDIGPLKDRVPPVTGYSFLMARRFEIAPTFSLSFRDAFWTKYVVGATLTYHFTETLGLALRGGYAFTSVSGAAQVCPSPTEACFSPSKEQLDGKGPGQIKLITALDFEWAPLYGKISLLAEGFAHFNLYLIAGPTAVQYKAPKDGSVPGSDSAWAVGGEAGLGMRFIFNRWMALRFELRDVIYREKTQGATETTGASYQVRNQLFFDIGLSFFFPSSFTEG